MCTARDSSEFEDLKLKHPDEFLYLNLGDAPEIDGLDDAEEFTATRDAFKVSTYYLLSKKINFMPFLYSSSFIPHKCLYLD